MNRWRDWYEQGKRDLRKALLDIEHEFYEWACFSFQQSAEKVIKGLALNRGLTLWGHSLTEMLNLMSAHVEIPDDVIDSARLLDLYYIPPRYPNGFASGKPGDYFTKKQAREAKDAANSIVRFCEGHLPR
jgi:HEPN domain-containing protein